jgi:hypothetical protein
MRILPFMLCTLLALAGRHAEAADDLEALSKSPVWQVRYCIPGKYDTPSTEARRVLERLSADEVPAVAQQAFASYARSFVVLDRELVKKAFTRGDFDLIGVKVSDRKVFESPEFWIQDLDHSNDPTLRARAVRAMGMCGKNTDAAKLSEHLTTTNPYLLIELALAFHRLGDEAQYLKAIEAILALPIKETLHYQTYAIDCLIQTHLDRAKTAWKEVHEQFGRAKDCQPNWVYAHIAQEARLP